MSSSPATLSNCGNPLRARGTNPSPKGGGGREQTPGTVTIHVDDELARVPKWAIRSQGPPQKGQGSTTKWQWVGYNAGLRYSLDPRHVATDTWHTQTRGVMHVALRRLSKYPERGGITRF